MTQEQGEGQGRHEDANAILTTGAGENGGAGRGADGRGATEGGGTTRGGVKDDLEGGTTGATSMTGGDRDEPATGMSGSRPDSEARAQAAPGGKSSPAGEDMAPIGQESFGGSPAGESGDGESIGPASNGSFGSGTYNTRGNLTGPDSPAGADVKPDARGEGQGDDLANRLGGGEGTGTGLTGAAAATGDMNADRSEDTGASAQNAAGAGGPSAGDVGGMGGVRGHTGGSGRPPGGMSPLQTEQNNRD